MGVRIVGQEPEAMACLYDSLKNRAFGPVFAGVDDVEEFLEWCNERLTTEDLRYDFDPEELDSLHADWVRETGRDI